MIILITGVTGQDGSYLSEMLLNQGHTVIGIIRRNSTNNTHRIKNILRNKNLILEYCDLSDGSNIFKLVEQYKPNWILNMAAQSHVGISFDNPIYTADIDALGPVRFLEAIRSLKLDTKFYQAGTSELFGDVLETPQNENTPFNPVSPYAIAKRYAFDMCKLYRKTYNMWISSSILFNHESPRRGEEFVTRKITKHIANYVNGCMLPLELGNVNAKRDWGHARDYCEGIIQIMNHSTPDDYILATGETYSVKDFVNLAYETIGIKLTWKGDGIQEKAYHKDNCLVQVNPKFFRPSEVNLLIGDYKKAKEVLGWTPKTSFKDLVAEMVSCDLNNFK